MDSTVIKVENISKQYRLGSVGTGSLAHDLNRTWHRIRGKGDPYLKIGEANDRSRKASGEYVWALKNISFEVKQGEVLGVIGRNGAGKSTLLKILSRTTSPSTGSIKIKGKVASLLEVGTGFHPELSGRENIFLNGAILGMTKKEIQSKFAEIVDFAGVEKYIDTPVKRYSSGMYVRLAFGVAAHLDPEILIVDEVLAVGDAEFQKKALGKMKDVSNKDGRTVLFVSHNMGAIKSLCDKGLVMKNGVLNFLGNVEQAVSNYLIDETNLANIDLAFRMDRQGDGSFKYIKVIIRNEKSEQTETFFSNEKLTIEFTFESHVVDLSKIILSVGIRDLNNELVAFFSSDEMGFQLQSLTDRFTLVIPSLAIRAGNYTLWLFASYQTTNPADFCDIVDQAASITILPIDFWVPGKTIRGGNIALLNGWYKQ